MPRISYVDPDSITDPELAGYIADSRKYGTPRVESQAIRAHVPAVLRSFNQSWQAVFREGVLDHTIKELARVFVAKSLDCGYCAGQRSHLATAAGLTEREFDDVIEFRRSDGLRRARKGGAALRRGDRLGSDPGRRRGLGRSCTPHFTEPEIVELGYFIGLTMGQQKFLKTLGIKHGDLGTASTAGLAPAVAESLATSTRGSIPRHAPGHHRRVGPGGLHRGDLRRARQPAAAAHRQLGRFRRRAHEDHRRRELPRIPRGHHRHLMMKMQEQAERFGTEIVHDDVTKLELGGDVKRVTSATAACTRRSP